MENKNERTGLSHIYCGDGKGKTTAAIGAAIRAAGRGFRVLVLRLLKTDDSGEVNAIQNIPEIHVLPCVRSFGFSWNMTPEQKEKAAVYYSEQMENAWKMALETDENGTPAFDLLVMDEAIGACRQGFICEERLLELLRTRPASLEVILTGRGPSEALLNVADYVTEMALRRHPYERGIGAREGIEY